jgi:hypothetical protein
MPRIAGVIALLAGVMAAPLAAQATDPMTGALRAYQDLDYDNAARLLRQALADPSLPDTTRMNALMHLGATELFREQRDSAAAAFRRLVLFEPRYQPDQLRFPPEVSSLFQATRLGTIAVAVQVPVQSRISATGDRLPIRLYATAVHEVSVVITPASGNSRTVYSGGIGDSLEVLWDGRDGQGTPADSGPAVLVVTSRNQAGRPSRQVTVPLTISRPAVDTMPTPMLPADSLRRPETRPGSSGTTALLTGLGAGVTAALLPSLISGGESGLSARYMVTGALSVTGIVALVRARRPQPIPENIAWNRQLQLNWEREAERVRGENEVLRRQPPIIVSSGVARSANLP